MNRKDFLKGASLASLGLAIPTSKSSAKSTQFEMVNECTLIPSETAGPFPLDLTENQTFFRQDITESEEGIQLNLKLKIVGLDNCEPMQNVRVNIWHCDKDGIYSGYNTGNNPGDANGTQLRGYQFTDANGEVDFVTIFPGWYNGRICHIHFQVAVSSSYSAISQLTFPVDTKNALYADNSSIYTKGADPMGISQDNIFSDGHEFQLATLEVNTATGEYNSYMEVTVEGTGTTGVGHIERETAKVFELGQNFPNPYSETTTIPFTIKKASNIKLTLWDLTGKKVATILDEEKGIGEYNIEVNPKKYHLPIGNYVYQLEATHGNNIFRYPKMMTALK